MEIDDDEIQLNLFTRSTNLQDMCLTAVVRDIEFFVCSKTIPQKHIDFLFRAYSDELFSRHKILKKSLDEDTMLWFLNPHLKKVALPHVFHSERILTQLTVIGCGITSLNLENSNVTASELNSVVSCIPQVIHLNLSMTSCNDETLACIETFCPDLESLLVNLSNVTDSGLKNLCQGKLSLKKLSALYCGLSATGVFNILDRMPSLECLICDHILSVIYKVGTDSQKQYNLTELVYNNFPYVNEHNSRDLRTIDALVRVCPKLKKLHFSHPVSERVLNVCADFKNLEDLKIKMSHKRFLDFDVLTPILPISQNLKTLVLSCVEISPVILLESFRSLENLYLKNVSFTPFEKKDIKIEKTNLLSLVIKHIHMVNTATQAIILLISLSKNVTKLYLKHIKHLPPEVLDATLNSMKNLTFVNFDSTHIDMHYANLFFAVPSLSTIIMNKDIPTVESFRKSTLCTLSWRNICNNEYKSETNKVDDAEETDKYYYHKNEYLKDEYDVISEQCYSSSSNESDTSYFSDSDSSFIEAVILNEIYNDITGDSDESDMSVQVYSADSDSDDPDIILLN